MRKRSARAIDAVAFHQIVQDAPVRLNSLRFGMICQAAVISIISNPEFKGLARVSLVTFRVSRKEQPITKVTMKLSGIAHRSGQSRSIRRRHWRRLTMKPSGGSGQAVVIIVALLVWLSGFYVGRRIAKEREVTKVESEVRTVTVPEESIIHEMPDPAAVRVVCTEAGNARILRADRRRLNDACTTLLLPQALRTNR
jgi:hypothetical protein